jgi:hypothetical protein
VRQALLLGALVAVALFFSVPTLTQSSLASMGYWVDWANLLAIALGWARWRRCSACRCWGWGGRK